MEQENDIFTLPHFRDYVFIIVKRKKAMIISVVIAILIGFLSTHKGELVYTASVKIMIEIGERIYTSTTRNVGGWMYDVRQGIEKYDNEYEIMNSSEVVNKTVEMLGMEGEDAANYIRSAVSIKPIRKGMGITNMAYITAMSTDPKKAMDMANYTAKAYIETKEANARDIVKKTYDIYSSRLQELKNMLKDSEIKFNEFKNTNNIIGAEDVDLDQKSAQNLGAELVRTRNEIYKLNSLLKSLKELISQGSKSAALNIIASNYPNVANEALQRGVAEREEELLRLAAIYTDKHPMIIQKKSQIDELKKRIEEDLDKSTAHLNTDLKMLQAEEENIMYSLKLKNPDLGENRSEYFTLKQEVISNKALYDNLISNMKELDVSKDMSRIGDVKVLEWAKLPLTPERTGGNVALFFAPFLGLLLGLTLVFFIEYMDNTIKTDEDVKRYLSIPVIGIIPHMGSELE